MKPKGYCKNCEEVTERYADGHCKPCKRAYVLKRQANNPEWHRERCRRWRRNNDDRTIAARNAKHYALKRDLTPDLNSFEERCIRDYYDLSYRLGPEWQVDHIIPLNRGGLHHPDNLQIIKADENAAKRDRLGFIPSIRIAFIEARDTQ